VTEDTASSGIWAHLLCQANKSAWITVVLNDLPSKGDAQMKRLALGFAAALMFLTVVGAAPKNQTFTGEIMDSQCAGMGAHEQMIRTFEKVNTAKECTLACVKAGGKFVLFDATTRITYQLDDQKKPAQFAGARVTVTGTLDDPNKTIRVANIKLSPTK
jgi:hypothetical protein